MTIGGHMVCKSAITFFFFIQCLHIFSAPTTNAPVADEIIAQIELMNSNQLYGDPAKLFQEQSTYRQKIIQKLLPILESPQSTYIAKCCAAHYLGELHAAEAVDSLASQVGTILTPFGQRPIIYSDEAPAANALIKIGTPSIPAVIRTLSESDDKLVRFTCLQVIASIDNDTDITQLRLEKALKAEVDMNKKNRLQAALEMRLEHLKATGQ
jgi:hypothetical protein